MTASLRNNRPAWILILILLGVLVVLNLTSCRSVEWYQAKYCPTVSDSTRIEVNRVDSTVLIPVFDTIPADTLKLFIKVPCDDFEVTKETGRNKTTIKVVNGNLELESICKEWEYKYWVSKTISTLTEKTFHSEVRLMKEKKPWPWWIWFSLGALSMLIIWQRGAILRVFVKMFKPL